MRVRGAEVELIEERIGVGDLELSIVRPRDSEALLDEEAFEHEEFLPYWAELWPSAIALARELATRDLAGARVVELGCGLGIPSIVAAFRGAEVLATDWSPDAVEFTRANAERNGATLETVVCSWSDPGVVVERAPWDLILASDVLYERRNVDMLLEVLPQLVRRGEVLVADPGRPHLTCFLEKAAGRWRIDSRLDRVLRLRLPLANQSAASV